MTAQVRATKIDTGQKYVRSGKDTCAVYETKKGAVRAKFNAEGKCTIIWEDPKTDEKGTYSFIA